MQELQNFIKNTYKNLHCIAEPAFNEVKTGQFIALMLKSLGLSYKEHVGKTGLVAYLDSGKAGPTVALRTDMDALTFTDEKGEKKAVHACGHDAHMTIALATAKELIGQIPAGKVKFIFQPAEEIGAGARAMIAEGVLDDVDYLIGYHVVPQTLAKANQIIPQINWTACTLIEATIKGKTAHGSLPQNGINAVNVAVDIVNRVNAIACNPENGTNVKTTRFISPQGALNAIPDLVQLGFDLRSTSNEEMLALRQAVFDIIESSSQHFKAISTAHIVGTCPAAYADTSLKDAVRETVTHVLGENALLSPVSLTIGEDFNFYKEAKPLLKTTSLGIGCDVTCGLHDPKLQLNVASLSVPVDVFKHLILTLLTEKP